MLKQKSVNSKESGYQSLILLFSLIDFFKKVNARE
ncbi:MAG: hypothetical protein HGGPFJEG_00979 [Ignavibacteria bacterium]|nr:hypothetical protein [Ignavibacteria bacterium]